MSTIPEILHLSSGTDVPNNPRLPALLWRGALPAAAVAATLDPPCEPVAGGAWPVGGG